MQYPEEKNGKQLGLALLIVLKCSLYESVNWAINALGNGLSPF